MSASITLNAIVARQCFIPYYIHHPHLVSHLPRLGFVQPHQGRMDSELFLNGQVERHIQALDKAVATVRITAEVRLADTRHQIIDALVAGIYRSDR